MKIPLQFTEEDASDIRKLRDLLGAAAVGSPTLSARAVLEARALAETILDRFEQREAQQHHRRIEQRKKEVHQ